MAKMQINTQQTPTPSSNSSRKLAYTLIGVLLILAGALGYWVYSSHKSTSSLSTNSGPKKTGAYVYDYSKLDSFELKGQKAGQGITFSKPQEYKVLYTSTSNDQASLMHSIIKASVHASIGGIQVSSLNAAGESIDKSAKYFTTSLSNPNSSGYKSAVSSVQQFAEEHFGPLYATTLSSAQKFQSSAIKNNAWLWQISSTPKPASQQATAPQSDTPPFDVSSATPDPGQTASKLENYKGQVVFAVGKSGYYYFLVYNTDYNWSNNAASWAKVINSIKIDQ